MNIKLLKDAGFSFIPSQCIPYCIALLIEMACKNTLEKYFDAVFSSSASQSILSLPVPWVFLSPFIFQKGNTDIPTLFTVGWGACVQASENHVSRLWGLTLLPDKELTLSLGLSASNSIYYLGSQYLQLCTTQFFIQDWHNFPSCWQCWLMPCRWICF